MRHVTSQAKVECAARAIQNGSSVAAACREAGVSVATYYNLRRLLIQNGSVPPDNQELAQLRKLCGVQAGIISTHLGIKVSIDSAS